jgi:hypothetical protein
VFGAAAAAPVAGAAGSVLDISQTNVKFGKQPFGSLHFETITFTNTGTTPVLVDIETEEMPDDFSPGQPESTCPLPEDTLLAPGETCTHIVAWQPESIFPGQRSATLSVRVRDATTGAVIETRRIRLSGRAVEP